MNEEINSKGSSSEPTNDSDDLKKSGFSDDNRTQDEGQSSDDITLSGRIIPVPGSSIQFKKPLLIGPRKGVRKFTNLKTPNAETEEKNSIDEEIPEVKKEEKVEILEKPKTAKKSPAEIIQDNATPLPYKEPKWSGLPTHPYSLEVLKSGTIVDNYNISEKNFYVFGRLANLCDIVLAHPTVSRFHAVMQFRLTGDELNPPGFYIYDLGSTHGTFLNKLKIKPNIFVRVHVGHMIKFGLSTRNFILQGPVEDEEPESELTITEMKEIQFKKKLEAALANEKTDSKDSEDDGVDWGMGEDADEETDLSENPYAMTTNEELYINDPKKTLRGWFEREGYELEYNCEEKGYAQFVCRVELPIDNSSGLPTVAEAVVRGKKKEAVVQCALEACRILDRHGLLRQSNHESKKRKAKNWEEDDYYDSDDDTFLDRTGTIEKKRQNRMEQAGVKNTTQVHTYQSLIEEHKKITDNIQRIESELEQLTKKTAKDNSESKNDNEDELDAYMSNIFATEKKDKSHVNKLKIQLASLKKEEVKIRNLANIAKPAELPPLKPIVAESSQEVQKQKLPVMIGKRKVPVKKPVQFNFTEESEDKSASRDSGEEVDSD